MMTRDQHITQLLTQRISLFIELGGRVLTGDRDASDELHLRVNTILGEPR